MTDADPSSPTDRVTRWLSDKALPLWATRGVDARDGGFVERLFWNGDPDLAVVKRVRVQARQLYVYSHAALARRMPGAAQVAEQGYNFIMRHAFPDGIDRGSVHSLRRDGTPHDRRRDTYDHAFLLFALSWYYRLTNLPEVRAAMLVLGDAIWSNLRHPGGAGFVVDDSGIDALHQNPHMHLFEAVLAAFDATSDPVFRTRADELFALFQSKIYDRKHHAIREHSDARWRPHADGGGPIVEPGHHCEWVWLLKWYADQRGQPLCDEAIALHRFAERYGRQGDDILLVDELHLDGSVRKGSRRSWPQTEAIKADIAVAEATGAASTSRVDAIVTALFDNYLDPAPCPGTWIDWIDARGQPLVQAIPASTFYHLYLGFSEYLRPRP